MANKGLNGYYAVAVITQGCGTYYYAIFEDGNAYTVGDKVLVSGVNNGVLEIAEILTPAEAAERGKKAITAEVISKVIVDFSAYESRVVKRKQAAEIKKKLDQKAKQLDEIQKYEFLAKVDSEFATLLEEYKKVAE